MNYLWLLYMLLLLLWLHHSFEAAASLDACHTLQTSAMLILYSVLKGVHTSHYHYMLCQVLQMKLACCK
jgi:hypothetical protein